MPATVNEPADTRDCYPVLTLTVGPSRCALDVGRVLYLSEHRAEVKKVPVTDAGLIGLVSTEAGYVPVYDLALLLGHQSARVAARELIATLVQREQDHVDWLAALKASITSGEPFTRATDPHQCAFGRWYDSFETADEELRAILALFDTPHRTIHSLAARLLAMRDSDGVDVAVDALRLEEITTLSRLRKLFAMARDHLESVQRPVNVLLAGDDGRPCMAVIVDELQSVTEFPRSALRSRDSVGIQWPAIDHLRLKGLFQAEEHDYLWFEPSRRQHAAA